MAFVPNASPIVPRLCSTFVATPPTTPWGRTFHNACRRSEIFLDDNDYRALVLFRCREPLRLPRASADAEPLSPVSTPRIELSAGMHRLNCLYAMRFNKRYKRSGHPSRTRRTPRRGWATRRPSRYVVDNPVRLAGTGATGRGAAWRVPFTRESSSSRCTSRRPAAGVEALKFATHLPALGIENVLAPDDPVGAPGTTSSRRRRPGCTASAIGPGRRCRQERTRESSTGSPFAGPSRRTRT